MYVYASSRRTQVVVDNASPGIKFDATTDGRELDMYMHMYKCMYMYMCVYAYIYTYIYIHVYVSL